MQIDKYQRDVYIVLTHIIGSQYTFTYTFLFVPLLNLSLNTLPTPRSTYVKILLGVSKC